MYISKIALTNYRGVKERREINLSRFSSIVGKNDAGKTIILNAIATFLDVKNFAITSTDFNEIEHPIKMEFVFTSFELIELLTTKIKSKVKKTEGLDEFIQDFIFDETIIYKREVNNQGKSWTSEYVLLNDFVREDLKGLYFKSDEEISAIIDSNIIQIPVEGKGRNSKAEKIKHIKLHFLAEPRANFWIIDDMKIGSLFPDVEMFKADYGLEADTKFKTASVTEIEGYFIREQTRLAVFQNEINIEMQKEAAILKSYMQEYASNLQDIDITPNIAWKDAIKSVDVSFQFNGDDKFIPMTHKGTGYRRLFMVARFRYLAEKSKGNNIIYLIEEPETFLHPTAQQDLLKALKELSLDNQVVTTTHSPVFAGATDVEGVVLCAKDGQSNYENVIEGNEQEFLFKIIDELGIKPSFNLRDNFDKILFVEGQDDGTFYKLIASTLLNMDLKNILILPCGGSSVESFINIEYFKKNGRELFLILDSDKGLKVRDPKKPILQQQLVDKFNSDFGQAYSLKKSNIEYYFHPDALKRYYFHLKDEVIDIFDDDEDLKEYFKEKRINKNHNVNIFESMTSQEWEAVVEQELLDFIGLLN
ncbi:AAA family ATPase [Flavobacterium taihuense]|uniref:ATP-binding protein n=1 Tax=Flavobacterium taihuense TaxID=2857508 RepID=A0ABS6XWN7_9FLAO|nr:AAA family ATPase [Flavobacterium taihuense]MBW4361090.1 ATP-binding protein [Flavobacterium taihuense]